MPNDSTLAGGTIKKLNYAIAGSQMEFYVLYFPSLQPRLKSEEIFNILISTTILPIQTNCLKIQFGWTWTAGRSKTVQVVGAFKANVTVQFCSFEIVE